MPQIITVMEADMDTPEIGMCEHGIMKSLACPLCAEKNRPKEMPGNPNKDESTEPSVRRRRG